MREPSLDLSQSDVLQFLELTPDGVFAQRAGIIVFANAAFAAAMRVPAPSSLVGKELLSIIAPGDRAQIAGQLRERGPGLARPPADVRCLRADGSIAIFEYSAMRVGEEPSPTSIIVCRDVTAARAQTEALRRAEAEFRLVFEGAPIGMALTSLDGRYLRTNYAMSALLGYSEDELRERTFSEVTHPDDRALDRQVAEELNRTGISRTGVRKRYLRRDGTALEVSLDISLVRDAEGAPVGYVSHIVDVSAQLKSAAALRQAEEQFRTLFESAPIGMAVVSLERDQRILRVNRALSAMSGYTEQEFLQLTFPALMDKEGLREDLALREQGQIAPGWTHQSVRRYRAKDGHTIEAERHLSIVGDASGKPVAGLVQVIDITARRVAERELRDSEALHRLLVHNLPNVAVLLFNHELRYTLVEGERALESLGLQPSEAVGRLAREVARPESAAALEARYRRALAGEALRWEQLREERSFDCFANPMRDESGAVVGGVLMIYETTVQRRLQERVADSEARLSTLLENVGDSMWSLDREGRLTVFNANFAADVKRVFGATIERGTRLFELLPEGERALSLENHRRCLAGEHLSFEWSGVREGKPVHMLVTHNPIVVDGQIAGEALMSKDITARREMELESERRGRVVELLQAIAAAANEAVSSDVAIERSLSLVARFAGWSVGHAFALQDGALTSRRTWYLRDPIACKAFRQASEAMPFVSGASLPGRVLASKRPAWMSSLPDNAQFLRGAAAAKCALRSGFAFPILVGDEVATVVEFFSERDEQPAPQIVELMTNVGIQLGRVIERERHADLVRALSLTDELTGLHNRRGFLALAGQQLRGSLRSKKSHTVLFADLDGLKRINDSLGHEAGDEAIATFAQVLRRTFREGDIVARLGGDEFIVLLEGQLSSAQAALVRLTASLVALNEERPGPRTLAASVGVVEVPLDGSEPLEAIVARADAAMYQVKRARRATRDR